MTKFLCVLVLFYIFHYGVTQEDTTTSSYDEAVDDFTPEYIKPLDYFSEVFPEYSSTFDAINTLVNDTKDTIYNLLDNDTAAEIGTALSGVLQDPESIQKFLTDNGESIYNLLDNDTAAEIGMALSGVLQDPESIKKFLNDNGGTAVQFTKGVLQNVTEETTEMRQRIIEDFLLAVMKALSTEVGQTFMKTVTRNLLSEVLSNSDPMNIMSMVMSYADSGNSGGSKDSSGSLSGSDLFKILKAYATGSARSSTEYVEEGNDDVP